MLLNIIHLAERADRWQLLQHEFAAQNITDYRVWEGIVDDSLTRRGISRAHKNIIRYSLEQGLPSVVIGEDDLHFTSPGAYDFYLANKPPEFDIYLAGIVYGNIDENNFTTDFSGLTLYLIHERFYNKMLALPEEEHIDRALSGWGKFVVCDPMAVIPHNGYSDSSKRYIDYAPYFKGKNCTRLGTAFFVKLGYTFHVANNVFNRRWRTAGRMSIYPFPYIRIGQ